MTLLQPALHEARQDVALAATIEHSARPRRYALQLPSTILKVWGASSTPAMNTVLGDDELGKAATSLF
jgi:hypothetical protein